MSKRIKWSRDPRFPKQRTTYVQGVLVTIHHTSANDFWWSTTNEYYPRLEAAETAILEHFDANPVPFLQRSYAGPVIAVSLCLALVLFFSCLMFEDVSRREEAWQEYKAKHGCTLVTETFRDGETRAVFQCSNGERVER